MLDTGGTLPGAAVAGSPFPQAQCIIGILIFKSVECQI